MNCDEEALCFKDMEEKQGRIHDNLVADGWAGEVLKKSL